MKLGSPSNSAIFGLSITLFYMLLITPWYHFDKKRLYKPTLAKIYGCVLILIKLFLTLLLFKDFEIHETFPGDTIIYYSLITNLVVLILVTITKSVFTHGHKWVSLFKTLQQLDSNLNTTKNLCCIFFVKQTIFIVSFAFGMYGWLTFAPTPYMKFLLSIPMTDFYYEFLIVSVYEILVQVFREKYKEVNDKLLNIQAENKFYSEVRNLKKRWRVLGQSVQTLNRIFGYQILLVILHCGLELVAGFYGFYILFRHDASRSINHFFLSNIWSLTHVMVKRDFVVVDFLI